MNVQPTPPDPMLAAQRGQAATPSKRAALPILLVTGLVLGAGALLLARADRSTNKTTLAALPKPVTVVEAVAAKYRPNRSYVATVEPWAEAKLGPQLVSAYVDTVLVRPGAIVKKGEVLATLDCRGSSAQSQAVAMQARALDARQKAVASEATRLEGLVGKGFVSANEAEQKLAQSTAEEASLLAARAKLLGTSLEVNDCVLRAPFDGEVATRFVDPGAFVKPGTSIVTVIDRSTVRITAEAPETDFAVVAPGSKVAITLVSTKKDLSAVISRRSPAADPQTRTVHFELDVTDPARAIPVGTTAELRIDVGEPASVAEVPLVAATIKGAKASVFVIEGDRAKQLSVAVKGESAGKVFLGLELKPGTQVVTEGRALLNDGDKVTVKVAPPAAPAAAKPTQAPEAPKAASEAPKPAEPKTPSAGNAASAPSTPNAASEGKKP